MKIEEKDLASDVLIKACKKANKTRWTVDIVEEAINKAFIAGKEYAQNPTNMQEKETTAKRGLD